MLRRLLASTVAVVLGGLVVSAGAAAAPTTTHTVGGTTGGRAYLSIVPGEATCGTAGTSTDRYCRYNLHGSYTDQAANRYLGSGVQFGRIIIDKGGTAGDNCWPVHRGVVKFGNTASPAGGLSEAILRLKVQSGATVCRNASTPSLWHVSASLVVTSGGNTGQYVDNTGSMDWTTDWSPTKTTTRTFSGTFSGTVTGPAH